MKDTGTGGTGSRHWNPELGIGITRWTVAAFLCIGLTLVLVVGVSLWGVYHDLELISSTLLQGEMGRLRSHAARTVGMIQDEVWRSEKPKDLTSLQADQTLRRHWGRTILRDPSRLYASIVDNSGRVIAHSEPSFEGKQLSATWYVRLVPEVGDDVVETTEPALTGGARAFDVRVPIFINDKEVGTYHSSLRYDWAMQRLAEKRSQTLQVWSWVFVGVAFVVLIAGFSLYQISRRMTVIGEAMKLARVRRFVEIGQLMSGIAHEIRNPLNAMRLNLHVLARHIPLTGPSGESAAGTEEQLDPRQIIHETNQEIERVEGLMRILLGYARPDQPHDEDLNFGQELQSTLNFLRPVLERGEMLVRVRVPEVPVFVHMDRDRLRQIVLNLINNAKDATGPGGTIEVSVVRQGGRVEVSVADDGPGVPPADRERIFEPFYSTKEMGTGLGLPLVRRYIEDVGGTIVCRANEPRGARFVIQLNEVSVAFPPSPTPANF
ncbi:MAG: HAMP domain-containing sensor histidine kinase [Pirellulaceae bacterium]|nr:HAMP domain-containing sensor histidine kinase [Pirellulaceae bacterium]